ncbi:hypothetical protein CYMTET_47835 [Cymbomonas tetramitiformis]|uniref:Jacalin-type lectin domain-containing protein n=1 Tax=Cymbomonas tetramitiformis TaxID=36881 RepID=A0AAE0BTG6_9CHLO|nr:hypothetical protein CYMTET_47835 [Cymbomonas tetramitiformis]
MRLVPRADLSQGGAALPGHRRLPGLPGGAVPSGVVPASVGSGRADRRGGRVLQDVSGVFYEGPPLAEGGAATERSDMRHRHSPRRRADGHKSHRGVGREQEGLPEHGGRSTRPQEVPPKIQSYAGGAGGNPKVLECGVRQRVASASGRAGDVVDKLGFGCVSMEDEVEALMDYHTASETVDLDSIQVGGKGGDMFDFRCPRGHYIHRISVRAGVFLDAIQFHCASAVSNETISSKFYGGEGGELHSLECQQIGGATSNIHASFIQVISVSGGDWVDRVQLDACN